MHSIFFVNSCKKEEPEDPIITWSNPVDITVGVPLSATQLNASCNVPGTFVYTPAIGTVLNIGANQTLQVDFTPTDTKHYNTQTKTVKINVIAKKDPIITWVNPVDITVGTLLSSIQLNATADIAGTFVYTPPIGASLSVGVNQDLKVDFTPTDVTNYNTTSKIVKINVVSKKDPIITWVKPADIAVGTLLSSIQLNATADVAGTFVYTPSIGTSLSVGLYQDLKVDFTPIDVTNYNTASKTVKINVKAPTSSTVTDYDGNIYNTVTIGTQVWMAENLRTTKYADGTSIPLVNTTTTWDALTATSKAYCWYNDDAENKATYGALYTWATAMNGTASVTANPSGIQGVCPSGWHLPSDAEWTQLTDYLGGESVASGKLKETGTSHWVTPNTGATNETGFTALPGGYCYNNGAFSSNGNHGLWWSATESNATNVWFRGMYYNDSKVYNSTTSKEVGFSVRCLRD